MMMFCLGIEPILRFLDERQIDFVCYADDIVVAIDQQNYAETLEMIRMEYGSFGL